MSNDSTPIVSVVIPTRNRIDLLKVALDAVASQSLRELEVIVVDDGSDASTLDAYPKLWASYDGRFQLQKPAFPDAPGTGPSATRNRGIAAARGEFVAFCDDDDHWNRSDHLELAAKVMRACEADLYFSNMRGENKGKITIPDWFPDSPRLARGKRVNDEPVVYEVSLPDMAVTMRHHFANPSGFIIRRSLLDEVGGFWERTDFGEDMDLTLRVADRCRRILYRPDPVVSFNVSPRSSAFNRRTKLDQSLLCVLDAQHAESLCRDRRLRCTARSIESWHLRKIAGYLMEEGRAGDALSMAWRAVCIHPRPGAAVFWARVVGKAILDRLGGGGASAGNGLQ